MSQSNMSLDKETTETDKNEGGDENHLAGRNTSFKYRQSYTKVWVNKTLDSIEDWAFEEQDTIDEFCYEDEQKIMKIIEWNEELKDAEYIESLENWTVDEDDIIEDSGYEDELELKMNHKHLTDRTQEIKSSSMHR